jgi:hypothetical protein
MVSECGWMTFGDWQACNVHVPGFGVYVNARRK